MFFRCWCSFATFFMMVHLDIFRQSQIEAIVYKAELLNTGKVQYDGAVSVSTMGNVLGCLIACSKNEKCMTFMYNGELRVCIQHLKTFRYQDPMIEEFGWKMYLYTEIGSRCPTSLGFVHYRYQDICYNFNDERVIDYEGHILPTCQSYGAELLRIDSQERQTYVEQVLDGRPTIRVAIQGYSYNPGNQWTFFDGTPLQYTNWARAPLVGLYYLQMFTDNKWTERSNIKPGNTETNIFMCEIR